MRQRGAREATANGPDTAQRLTSGHAYTVIGSES